MFLPFAREVCGGLSVRDVAKRCVVVAAAVISFDTAAVEAGGTLQLYDAALGALPDQMPWSWSYLAIGTGSISRTMTSSALVFDTSSYNGRASFGRAAGAILDSDAGFAIDFSLRIGAESHVSTNRSGFSIIVIDQAKEGIELSFWTDQVFAKNADKALNGSDSFTHGESRYVDTQTKRNYRLTVQNGQYTLATAGVLPLPGALRDYAAVADWPFNAIPYGTANYISFGDNTDRASALVELSNITLAPVPEPGEWALMAAGLVCIAGAVRRRRHGMPAAC